MPTAKKRQVAKKAHKKTTKAPPSQPSLKSDLDLENLGQTSPSSSPFVETTSLPPELEDSQLSSQEIVDPELEAYLGFQPLEARGLDPAWIEDSQPAHEQAHDQANEADDLASSLSTTSAASASSDPSTSSVDPSASSASSDSSASSASSDSLDSLDSSASSNSSDPPASSDSPVSLQSSLHSYSPFFDESYLPDESALSSESARSSDSSLASDSSLSSATSLQPPQPPHLTLTASRRSALSQDQGLPLDSELAFKKRLGRPRKNNLKRIIDLLSKSSVRPGKSQLKPRTGSRGQAKTNSIAISSDQ